jgi:hypothetical protein
MLLWQKRPRQPDIKTNWSHLSVIPKSSNDKRELPNLRQTHSGLYGLFSEVDRQVKLQL